MDIGARCLIRIDTASSGTATAAAGDAAGELPALLDMCTSGQFACDKMRNHGYVHIMLRLSVYVATKLPRMTVHESFVGSRRVQINDVHPLLSFIGPPAHPALGSDSNWAYIFLMFLSIDFIALLFELRDTRLRLRLGAAILDVGARCFIRIDTASLVRRLRRPGRS